MRAVRRTIPHQFRAVLRFIGIALLSLSIAPHATGEEKPRLPNFVIVFADDLGYGDLGCYGGKNETPNLDRMAREGVRGTDFYVPQAVCSASRTALLTGCYPNRLGILGALNQTARHGISDDEMTIGQVLKQRGYATAVFGKWHLGHHPRFLPLQHGFDEYLGLPYSNDMFGADPMTGIVQPLLDGEKVLEQKPEQSKLTTLYTERAVKFIEKNKDQPFFLYVPHTMVHVPLAVSDKFKGKSQNGLYGDVMMEVDWSVGQILATVKRLNLDDNTLVIFTADNGPWLSYGNHGGSAGPLREGKGTEFEGGVREPFVARWPGHIPAGTVCKEPAMTIDLLPTLAKLAGAPLPKNKIDGLDISPLLLQPTEAKSPHEALFFYWGRELQAVRSGKWKLHFPHSYRSLTGKPGMDGKSGGYTQEQIGLALFDLDQDIGEKTNVAEQHPDVVTRLKALAEQAREDLGDSATKQEGKGVRAPGMLKSGT